MNGRCYDSTMMDSNLDKPHKKQPIMHALGQSIGILWKAIREPVKKNDTPERSEKADRAEQQEQPERRVINREVKQIKQGSFTLRETTIREVEISPAEESDEEE